MTVPVSNHSEDYTATEAKYIDVPIIDIFVTFVENNTDYENSVKTMISGMLSHYFPVDMGYVFGPKQNRHNRLSHFLVSRLRRRFFDHALVKAKRPADTLEESSEQLIQALENSYTEHGQCWAILAADTHMRFYEYYKDLPKNENLLPWCPPGHVTNSFHIRDDSEIIDWMFNHMRQNDNPGAR